jgi:hypothetical protein
LYYAGGCELISLPSFVGSTIMGLSRKHFCWF